MPLSVSLKPQLWLPPPPFHSRKSMCALHIGEGWSMLPRVVLSDALDTFKVTLALSNLIQLQLSLTMAEGLDKLTLSSHF